MSTLVWKLRSQLSPRGRQQFRRVADAVLNPIGSIHRARLSTKCVALTFDDGPDPEVTPRLLDLLRKRRVRATFFVLTEKVAVAPQLTRMIVAGGHEIALHGDRHDRLTEVGAAQLWRRVRSARSFLEQISGQKVRFFRPPFGAQSFVSYLVTRAARLDVVVWTSHAEDWIEGTPVEVAHRALRSVTGGDIVLLHDGLESPPDILSPSFDRVSAIEILLDGMMSRGLQPVTVGELVECASFRRTAWFRP